MIRGCANEKCEKSLTETLNSPTSIVVTCDGDFVCCKECELAYIKQRNYFFDNIVGDEKKFGVWFYD